MPHRRGAEVGHRCAALGGKAFALAFASIRVDQHIDPLARHSLSPTELKQLLAADETGEPFLVFRDEQKRLSIFPLDRTRHIRSLGRGSEMDLPITWDNEVSALHAELQGLSGEWTIVDDGLSTNGTYVNGRRIGGRQRLRNGDRIRLGRTILVYRAMRPAPVASTVSPSEGVALQSLTHIQRGVLVALCRPFRADDRFSTPATNQQIANELYLSVEAVKMHMRTLFAKFDLSELPQNVKRARLAERVMQLGVVSPRDLD